MALVKHTLYNAAGLAVPIIAALATTPILIKSLGVDRFGILTLIWAIVNYFGIFDLGLGRALTLQMSVLMAAGESTRINPLVRAAGAILLVLGVLAGLALLALGPVLIDQIKGRIDPEEMAGALNAMAFALPFIVVTSGARGALEAQHAFGVLNAIRIPMGIVNFVGPVVIALYGSGRLDDIAWLLAYARATSLALHLYFMCRQVPGVLSRGSMELHWFRVLMLNGGWITVSNVVGPLMGYLDRFIVALLLPASFVAYYATPQELILNVYVIPGALTAVLFPRFAANVVSGTSNTLYWKSVVAVSAAMGGFCGLAYLFAYPFLSIWIDAEFASNAYEVMRILLIGGLCGTIATVPYTYLQAVGRANIAALSHVAQLPLFLVLSYGLTGAWGIKGAAVAWSARLALDAVVLFAAVRLTNRTLARMPSRRSGDSPI